MQFLIKLKTILRFKVLFLIIITFIYCLIFLNINHSTKYNIGDNIFIGIIQEIKLDDNKLQITIKAKEMLLVNYYINEEKDFNYELGDIIKVIGELSFPNNNDNFNLFNYQKYLCSKKINYIVTAKEINVIEKSQNIFYKLKNQILNKVESMDNRDYLKAFILGDTSEIDDQVKSSYQTNGISHLFSGSGTL